MSAKEMIDKIKKCLIAGYDLDIITQEEMSILWNYITNLQDTLKDREEYCYGLETQLTNLQEEYEIELDENNKLSEWLVQKQKRIDKAVEYIEKSMNNPQTFYEYIFGDENGKVENLDKLLNILNGDK